MEKDLYVSPLDAFFNTERYEGETSAHLFLRMLNAYHEIPSNLKPPYKEFLNKILELRISDVKLLLQIWEEAIKDEEKDTKVIQEKNNILDSNEEEAFEQSLEESVYDSVCKTEQKSYDQIEQGPMLDENLSNFGEDSSYMYLLDAFLNIEKQREVVDHIKEKSITDEICMKVTDTNDHKEDDLLSIEKISDLLEIEYYKYIETHAHNFLMFYQSKQTNDLVHAHPIFDEANNQPRKGEVFEEDFCNHINWYHEEIFFECESYLTGDIRIYPWKETSNIMNDEHTHYDKDNMPKDDSENNGDHSICGEIY